jgi:glycosyltransferase involved in cell wall biosynthesis
MSKRVLFLTGLFPNEIREEIIHNSKFNIQFAADALQWSFVKGLNIYYNDLKVVNFPFVGSFPTLCKSPFIKEMDFGDDLGFIGKNVGYLNLIGLKNIDIYLKAKREIKNWIHNAHGEKVIIIYSAFLPFLKAAIKAKDAYNDLKIYLILPDLPEFMGGPNNFLYKIFKRYTNNALQKSFLNIDGYVLLSKYMLDKLPVTLPYTVVEGIFDNKDYISIIKIETEIKTILYTGTLARRYGILNLLEAFNILKEENLKLIICGDGDARNEVIAAAESNDKIIYKGAIERTEVLKLQASASLLVNPRTAEGEFTKYSFPSKTMEYLASGVPALIYKLPGIPAEYYDHCFSLDDVSPVMLAQAILNILKIDNSILIEKGKKAQNFIFENKNSKVQCKKIFDLIEN